jgi:hypothetical protein
VNQAGRADLVQVALLRLFDRRIALSKYADQLALGDRLVNQPDGAFTGDSERHE